MTEEADKVQSYGGEGVSASNEKQNDFGVKPDDAAKEEKEEDKDTGLLTAPGEILKAVKADGASHQATECDSKSQPGHRPVPVLDGPFVKSAERTGFMKAMHDRGDDASRSGSGHADEILRTAGSHALNVEASQSPRTADKKSEAAEPSESAQLAKGFRWKVGDAADSPGKRENGGRDAKANDVGERVELHAEFGVGAGHAGDATVERIENDSDADGFGRVVEVLGSAHQGSDDGVVSAKKIRGSHHCGKQEDAAAESGLDACATAFDGDFVLIDVSHQWCFSAS